MRTPQHHDTAAAPMLDEHLTELLEHARRHLGMDVAFVARQADGRNHYEAVTAEPGSTAAPDVGASEVLEETYCWRLGQGLLDGVLPDAASDPRVATLEVTERLGIGAFVGVPIHDSHGRILGTICCYSHEPLPDFPPERRSVLDVLSSLVRHRLGQLEGSRREFRRAQEQVDRVLDGGRPRVVMQPIVDLTSMRLVGLEALSRFGDATPGAVFADARAVGRSIDVELRSLAAIADALGDVRAGVQVAVNVGVETLLSPRADEILDRLGTGRVGIELTEHASAVDPDGLDRRVEELRGLGFRLTLDDVGTGIGGLQRMVRLQPEVIKLDRRIVPGVDADPARAAVVTAALRFAAATGAIVIAGGIERDADRERLHQLGVPQGQGYGIGRPVPVAGLPAEARAR